MSPLFQLGRPGGEPADTKTLSHPAAGHASKVRRFERQALPHLRSAWSVALMLTKQPVDAEELVEDAYARAWRHFSTIPRDWSIRVWILHLVVDANRSKRATLSPLDGLNEAQSVHRRDATDALDDAPFTLRSTLDSLSCEDVREALGSLAAELAVTLWLVDGEGLRYRDVARILEVSEDFVSSRLLTARRSIRAQFARRASRLELR